MEKAIWVLGSKHPNAHNSISWLSSFPNFSNCDVLIVNLQSLGKQVYNKRKSDLFEKARRYIFDMLMTGEKLVFIILPSHEGFLDWLPVYPELEEIAPARVRQDSLGKTIDDYLETVEECPFYIRDFNFSYVKDKTNPKSECSEKYSFTEDARDFYFCELVAHPRIENRAKQMIGGQVMCEIHCGLDTYTRVYKQTFSSGITVFLPPSTKITVEQAIDIMVNIFTGGELIESPPQWENKIDMPGLQEKERQIVQKEEEKKTLIKDIEELKNSKDNLIKFRRLLWTDGTPLENAVKDAFVTLGFSEIRKIREKNLEDWVIDFKFVPDYKHGVFEIKGSEKRTSLSDLNQCDKWVKDYLLEKNLQVKGIFVSNQYRRGDILTSLKQREHFEKNELKFARQREICILPSHEIFYAIVEKMKGNPQITRKFIEEKIAATNKVCKVSET